MPTAREYVILPDIVKKMWNRTAALLRLLNFMYCARRWDSFHSPLLFRLFSKTCDERKTFSFFNTLEEKRRTFLKTSDKIVRHDLGAGSLDSSIQHNVSAIAGASLSRPFQCRFMARLASELAPRRILELGTSLGISTAYMAFGSPQSQIITVEGDPSIAQLAQKLFRQLSIQNIEIVNQDFDEFINDTSTIPEPIDLLFIDGNHKGEYLLKYFRSLSKSLHPGTVVIVDDIYWSADMHDAWQQLIHSPGVTQSVDCFHFGVLFFTRDFIVREHHRVRFPVRSYFQ